MSRYKSLLDYILYNISFDLKLDIDSNHELELLAIGKNKYLNNKNIDTYDSEYVSIDEILTGLQNINSWYEYDSWQIRCIKFLNNNKHAKELFRWSICDLATKTKYTICAHGYSHGPRIKIHIICIFDKFNTMSDESIIQY